MSVGKINNVEDIGYFCWTDSFKLLRSKTSDLHYIKLLDQKRKKQIGRMKKLFSKAKINSERNGRLLNLEMVDGHLQSYFRQYQNSVL